MSITINPPTAAFPYPTLTLDAARMVDFVGWCKEHYIRYGFGSKFTLMTNPGERQVDCSGMVRYEVWLGSGGYLLPDGSANQLAKVKELGFKHSDVESAKLLDDVVRIAVLPASASHDGIGHVVLIVNGLTIESHGGKGPDRRPWDGLHWQSSCEVFVLTAPEAA